MESGEQSLIPGLPDDLALRCLAKLSHGYHGLLQTVSKRWRNMICSSEYANYKAKQGWTDSWLFVLTERSNNQWIAYDPDADRWHPLPKIVRAHDDWQHSGFSCVCVCNHLLVIGGSYAPQDSALSHRKPIVTNEVLQFDPFTKQWTSVASMRTPRSHFACSVINGKVYVAGGRNSSSTMGLALVEAYDPVTDKWEELPPMPYPQMDCLGLSYKDKLHVLGDQAGLLEQNTSELFDPSNGTWCTVEDTWPFSRAMQFAVQVMEDGRLYTVVDWGESLIKTRDNEKGEWYNVGSVPSVILPYHSRPLETFGYGFAALKNKLYVLGGTALKWEWLGGGRYDIRRLSLVRFCDPSDNPLKWKETRPMCGLSCGSILGCASMEERFSS
ncbi:Kelch repeat-containing F-box family protein [Melia azedarach]|uniref:Kelch repeat-containing F-box family protein n=1 Tax=Melia azedarach TaxID=155640 RepID=A0ACC1YH08_MELAZ|nr:Kelch repeat-containing F-box family protein [Melia azedarach]